MRKLSLPGILTAAAGLALLVWIVVQVGVAQILRDVRQVGWGLAAVIAIGGARFFMRAVAWHLCVEGPRPLPLGAAFAAVVCGDAVGNVTPLGPIVGEPAKAAFVRRQLAFGPAATALAIENVLYTLSAAAMIAAAMIALIFRFELPMAIREVGEAAIVATIALFAVALAMLWRQPALVSRALGVAPRLRPQAARVRRVEEQIYTFASRNRHVLPGLAASEIAFHVLGVLEVHLTLRLLFGTWPPVLTSFILEGTNRLITVVFKFVPLRLGVDEAGAALFTRVLGLGANPGVALGIVRHLRVFFWTAAGAALLVRSGLAAGSPQVPQDQTENG
jgi:hypothetical protein